MGQYQQGSQAEFFIILTFEGYNNKISILIYTPKNMFASAIIIKKKVIGLDQCLSFIN